MKNSDSRCIGYPCTLPYDAIGVSCHRNAALPDKNHIHADTWQSDEVGEDAVACAVYVRLFHPVYRCRDPLSSCCAAPDSVVAEEAEQHRVQAEAKAEDRENDLVGGSWNHHSSGHTETELDRSDELDFDCCVRIARTGGADPGCFGYFSWKLR